MKVGQFGQFGQWLMVLLLAGIGALSISPGLNILSSYLAGPEFDEAYILKEEPKLAPQDLTVDEHKVRQSARLLMGYINAAELCLRKYATQRQTEAVYLKSYLWYEQLRYGFLAMNTAEQVEFCNRVCGLSNPLIRFTGQPTEDASFLKENFELPEETDEMSAWSIYQEDPPYASIVVEYFEKDLRYKSLLVY